MYQQYISIQLNWYGVPECVFSSYSLSVEISALVTFLSNDMGSATEWRLRREQLRRDGNLNGCDGAHRHTQPLKRISFIIKWLYLFQFFLYCIVFFVFVLKVLIFTLYIIAYKNTFPLWLHIIIQKLKMEYPRGFYVVFCI